MRPATAVLATDTTAVVQPTAVISLQPLHTAAKASATTNLADAAATVPPQKQPKEEHKHS
jgi:hypothetical protein